MRRFAIIPGIILFLTPLFVGCGGGSSSNSVSQVVISPTSVSVNSGDVVQITASPENSAGNTVSNVTVTFGTSNSALATVSPSGLICGGVWDTSFIVCNGLDSSGNPLAGQATVTASAQGITSGPVPVTVHVKVTSVVVDPVAGCTSAGFTQQFTSHVCSSIALPHDPSGPCSPNAKEVTSQIGPVTWGAIDSTVATVDTNGLVTGINSGVTGIFANVSNVNSTPSPFRTCMPIEIRLHLPGDAPGSPTTSASMTQNQTLTLETDMTDEKGVSKNSIATIIVSDAPAVVSLSTLTLTASSFGGSGIMAGCTPPTCGNGLNTPVYSNLFSVTVAGSSPAPMVYATTSFTPPSGTAPTLIPIDTSKSPPAVGTAVTLPGVPNSMVFAANGTVAYIGTNAGLVSFNPTGNAITLVDAGVTGKVLAVSPAGTKVIVSNAAKDPQGNVIQTVGPSQRVWVFDQSSNTTQTFVKPGAVAAAIDNDGFRDYIGTNDTTGNVYVFSPSLSLQTINIPLASPAPPPPPGAVINSIASLPSDPFVYLADSNGLDVVATCNNVQQMSNPPTNSPNIQLVQAVPNANVIVAVDSPGVDVETVSVSSILSGNPVLPFTLSPANCQPNVSYSNQFLNLGIGAFTAHQLLVASNGSRIAVLPAGNANIISAVPGSSPSTATFNLVNGGTEALSGGMLPDGNTLWVGVNGTNTVDKIDLTGGGDTLQVATSFKKSDGSAAPPDIVAVQPK